MLHKRMISPICYKTTRPATSPFWSITFQLEIVNMHINHYYKTINATFYLLECKLAVYENENHYSKHA